MAELEAWRALARIVAFGWSLFYLAHLVAGVLL